MKRLIVYVFLAPVISGLASASIILTLDGDAPTGAGPYTWSYTAHVSGDEQLNISATAGQGCTTPGSPATCGPSGTYFTIYDVAGFTGNNDVTLPTVSPTGGFWAFSTQLTGITAVGPGGALPVVDSGTLTNITFYYTLSSPQPATGPNVSELTIPGFSFKSTSNIIVMGNASWSATKFRTAGFDGGVAPVQVPMFGPAKITSFAIVGGVPTITFTTIAGRSYKVERKDDLTNVTWTTVTNAGNVSGTGNPVAVPDPDPGAGSLPKRFYHVVLLP